MPQLTKYARQALDRLEEDISEIAALRKRATREALDQTMVKLLMEKIENIEARMRRHIASEIEPLLERQAPQLEKRVAVLEAQMHKISNDLRIEWPAADEVRGAKRAGE